jgi:putative phage-type endonuclease
MTFAARKIGTAETGSPEWHRLREGRMTGSRIAAALGLSPWTSPFTLFYQMLGEVPESIETPVMEWGNRLEGAVIQKYADTHPNVHVVRTPGVWQNKERPYQVSSPDALVAGPGPYTRRRVNGLFEAKTSGRADEWGATGSDQIPIWYRCQVTWYMDCLGIESCDLGALINGQDYREYTIYWNEQDAVTLRKGAMAFLDQVREGRRPPVDGSDSTYQTIKQRHPLIEPGGIDVPPEIAIDLSNAREVADQATEAYKTALATLADLMGPAQYAFVNNAKLADRRAKNGGTPYVQLASITSIRKALQ